MSDTPDPLRRSIDEMRGPTAPQPPARAPLGRRQGEAAIAPEQHMPDIRIGFGNMQSWEFTWRVARGFALSSLVPESYRALVPAGKFGEAKKQMVDNPSAIPNCVIALNMAQRLNADPLMVMQNLHIIEGRPAWSAQFVIAAINASARFTPLQYEVTDEGMQTINFEVEVWDDSTRSKIPVKKTFTVPKLSCVAWCMNKATGERLESVAVTMEMAVLEGWHDRKGSKWQTFLRSQMLRYRAASFFGRTYCPDLLMGLRTVEEEGEIIEAERETDGSWHIPPETVEGQPAAEAERGTRAAQLAHEQTVQVDLGRPAEVREPDLVDANSGEPSVAKAAEVPKEAPAPGKAKAPPTKQPSAAQDGADGLFGSGE